MSSQRQIIVTPKPTSTKPLGSRNDINLKKSFVHSPIHNGEMTDEERKKEFQKLVMEGVVLNGNGFDSFNRDYEGAPNLEEVETGGGDLPASPYMPNLTSPGPGSVNAADKPEYQGDIPDKDQRNNWGTGMGGTVSPSKTSSEIAKSNILKGYISGRSYQGSDGKA